MITCIFRIEKLLSAFYDVITHYEPGNFPFNLILYSLLYKTNQPKTKAKEDTNVFYLQNNCIKGKILFEIQSNPISV